MVAENPSASLYKISEIYDRIAFAGVGKYNEFDRLREAGIRWADGTGFTYSREDVDARALANYYAQHLGDMFTEGQKPLEVEILVAQLGNKPTHQALPDRLRGHHHRRAAIRVLGGDAETIKDRFAALDDSIESLAFTLKSAVSALAGPDRTIEVATSRSGSSRTAAPAGPSRDSATTKSASSSLSDQRGPAMLRRIYGIETEYGITFSLRGQRRLSPDEVSRFLFRKVVAWGRSSNVFLENGSRLYLDVGSHPEYATAECDSSSDVVAQDKAGESILRELVDYAQGQLRDEGIRGDIYLFKNNTDSTGNSYGCHENYCIERIDDLTGSSRSSSRSLISRQIFTGAGKVVTNAKGTAYSMSQRAEHIWEASPRPPRAAGRSSTPATSRTPTPRSTGACTSSSATPT
jgi:proteasome alpha subunit